MDEQDEIIIQAGARKRASQAEVVSEEDHEPAVLEVADPLPIDDARDEPEEQPEELPRAQQDDLIQNDLNDVPSMPLMQKVIIVLAVLAIIGFIAYYQIFLR